MPHSKFEQILGMCTKTCTVQSSCARNDPPPPDGCRHLDEATGGHAHQGASAVCNSLVRLLAVDRFNSNQAIIEASSGMHLLNWMGLDRSH